jgi:GDP-fucose protein O-fucosyltransferase
MLRCIAPALTVSLVSVSQRVEIDVIFDNTFDVLEENSTIYIATDERNRTFFDLLRKRYKIYFMDDFKDLLEGVNTNYFGMVDQLVASRGKTFIGTYYSTFTGYINRVRGYHSQKDKAEGYELGVIHSYFDIPLANKYEMREYQPLKAALWAREFPIGWRDLDKGIGELITVEKSVDKKKPAAEEPKEAEQHKVKKVQEKAVEKSPDKGKNTLSSKELKGAKLHKVAGLSCKPYGGPSDEDAAEMVYWQDIPVDASFVSPFKSKEQQYLTFEPGTFVM